MKFLFFDLEKRKQSIFFLLRILHPYTEYNIIINKKKKQCPCQYTFENSTKYVRSQECFYQWISP